jgi:mevalonate kinase
MQDKSHFYSKVMLFGEYSIIHHSNGLTIPYSHFNGQLYFYNKNSYTDLEYAEQSNSKLKELHSYIFNLIRKDELLFQFNLKQFETDLANGLFFESTIPEGYGLGSSGALVAALYSRYALKKIRPSLNLSADQMNRLKQLFSQLESFNHGTSSGIDPLICYLKHPIYINGKGTIHPIKIPRENIQQNDAIFLIDTGHPGKTAPLVNLFMKKCNNKNYLKSIQTKLSPLTNACIQNLLEGHINQLFSHLSDLSAFQLEHLNEMIPSSVIDLWQTGLNTQEYFLKLCGSGGGGFLLGFTRHFSATRNNLKSQNLEVIPVYQNN